MKKRAKNSIVSLRPIPPNCRIRLERPAIKVVRECLRDFDEFIKVDDDPLVSLLLMGYDEEELQDKSGEEIDDLALIETAKSVAEQIVAQIRSRQLEDVHDTIRDKYPILANEWREPDSIVVSSLPPKLQERILGDDFNHEQFIRAYLEHFPSASVYDLTSVWQQWAADNELHPAYPKNESTPDVFFKNDRRLKWLPEYIRGDSNTIVNRMNIWIKGKIIPKNFTKTHLIDLCIRGAPDLTEFWFKPQAAHEAATGNPPPKTEMRGRHRVRMSNIDGEIYHRHEEGMSYDAIAQELSMSKKDVSRIYWAVRKRISRGASPPKKRVQQVSDGKKRG